MTSQELAQQVANLQAALRSLTAEADRLAMETAHLATGAATDAAPVAGHSFFITGLTVFALFFYSFPTFLLALVLLYFFYFKLTTNGHAWFPAGGYVQRVAAFRAAVEHNHHDVRSGGRAKHQRAHRSRIVQRTGPAVRGEAHDGDPQRLRTG